MLVLCRMHACILSATRSEARASEGVEKEQGNWSPGLRWFGAERRLTSLRLVGEKFYCFAIRGRASTMWTLVVRRTMGWSGTYSSAYRNRWRHCLYQRPEPEERAADGVTAMV